MNKIKSALFLCFLVGVILIATPLPSNGQITNPPPPNPVGLPTQVLNYFVSFNTNLDSTFRDNRFDLWTGSAAVQGGEHPLLNELAGSYDFLRFNPVSTNSATLTGLSAEAVTRNEGVVGSLVSLQGGIGFNVIIHDTKSTLYLDGGSYIGPGSRFRSEDLFGEVGIRVKKAFGLHFYGGLGLANQFPRNAQVFTAIAGATF